MPPPLITVDAHVRSAIQRMRIRAATVATGVACPGHRGKPCGHELHRVVPPQTMPGELVWVRCICIQCGGNTWLPD